MIADFKTKLIIFIATVTLLVGGLVMLSHHPVSITSGDHAECSTACKIACLGQGIADSITTPPKLGTFISILSFAGLALIVLIPVKVIKNSTDKLRYYHWPPLYKQFESYRI